MGPEQPRAWVGIDEAGYGPNLGPLVMTAVVARGTGFNRPDLWNDLAKQVDRAGGDPNKLWVDDSKRVYASRRGLERLEAAAHASLRVCGATCSTLSECLDWLSSGSQPTHELERWSRGELLPFPRFDPVEILGQLGGDCRLTHTRWRVQRVAACVVGPEQFSRLLARHENKAAVHNAIFHELLRDVWLSGDASETHVLADKHGGRHYYYPALVRSYPEAWVERGPETAQSSRYTVRYADRCLQVDFIPRADATDSLVALASLVSKYIRERWMLAFNAFWLEHLPELRPTAGYPADAKRYRAQIEPHARRLGLDPALWWRLK